MTKGNFSHFLVIFLMVTPCKGPLDQRPFAGSCWPVVCDSLTLMLGELATVAAGLELSLGGSQTRPVLLLVCFVFFVEVQLSSVGYILPSLRNDG